MPINQKLIFYKGHFWTIAQNNFQHSGHKEQHFFYNTCTLDAKYIWKLFWEDNTFCIQANTIRNKEKVMMHQIVFSNIIIYIYSLCQNHWQCQIRKTNDLYREDSDLWLNFDKICCFLFLFISNTTPTCFIGPKLFFNQTCDGDTYINHAYQLSSTSK